MNPIEDLGPCQVEFNDIDIGPSFGDVIFRDTTEERPVHEAGKGVTPVNGVFVGRLVQVEVPLSRSTLATLASVIPGAVNSGGESGKVTVSNIVAQPRYANAKKLALRPIIDNVPSATDHLTLFKASPSVDMEVTFNSEGQRVYKLIFTGYPDENNKMYQFAGVVT